MRGMSQGRWIPHWLFGLILVVVIAVGSVLAYTKELPWTDRFKVHAIFPSAQTVRASAPVRIAGVNVGEVSDVDHYGEPVADPSGKVRPAIQVTMELDENALPLREDATFKVRPRLFLDGNYFVDVKPGSPSADEVGDGHIFPINQTAHSVQLDQILTTLQSDVRADLQTLLDEFGNALIRYKGAEGLRKLFRSAPPSYRYTALVSESQLGTHRGDLSGMIKGLGKVLGGLSRNEQALRNLVTNLRIVTGSFAAEDRALGRAIERLPGFLAEGEPTFKELNRALPSVRAFAREALPGIRKSPEALRAGLPLLKQLRALVSKRELRGLVAELRPTIPNLARLAQRNTRLFGEQRAFSSCFNEVIVPWSHSSVEVVDPAGLYPLEVHGRTFETTGYGFTGSSSESRSGDAAGQHLRVVGGGGTNFIRFPATAGRDATFGLTQFPIIGTLPRINDSRKTVYRPDVPCETQEPPNLEAGVGSPPEQESVPAPSLDLLSGPGVERLRWITDVMGNLDRIAELREAGQGRAAQRLIDRAQRTVDLLGLVEIDVERAAEAAGG